MKTTITPRTVESPRGIAARLTLLLMLGALPAPWIEAAPPERAGTFPYQSFVDNFVGPNSPLTYEALPNRDGDVLSVVIREKGSLTLTSTEEPNWVALAMVRNDGEPIVAEDTSMRVVARLANEASVLALWARHGWYVCWLYPSVNVGPDGEPVITSILSLGNWFGRNVVETMEVELNAVDNDVVVEFDTLGDTITMRAWAVNNPGVVYETVGWTEPPPGLFFDKGPLGLGALGGEGVVPLEEFRGVEYYQFKLKIIPPTSNRR